MSDTPSSVSKIIQVFSAFLMLGLTSFGGPIAHLSYFRTELVERRRWVSEQAYADLVALCQFLPGPASSQVGFALGLMRAGPWGGVAAWTAFTLPSALVLVLFSLGYTLLDESMGQGIIHGLKVAAVAIVAHAVWGMARNFCPDPQRAGIALTAALTVVLIHGPLGQVAAIIIGAAAGMALCRTHTEADTHEPSLPVSKKLGHLAGLAWILLLLGLPIFAWVYPSTVFIVMDAFYRAGALVFGGGHVVLPLLEAEVVQAGWVDADEFLAGYAATQAVPGPLFTFAAYLGSVMMPLGGGLLGASLALIMIFLPGILLLLAVLPYWNQLRRWSSAQALMSGANASVVGILGAALYHPVWTSAIIGPREFALALTGFLLLSVWKIPAWLVVIILGCGGLLINL